MCETMRGIEQPYYHLIAYKEEFILYLNGSMKCVLITKEHAESLRKGEVAAELTDLWLENKDLFHKEPELRLGPVGLTLNVANQCNLRCSYCYANGGNYHGTEGLMSTKMAKHAVRRFAEYFGELKRIKFFGGEPFLNYHAMKAACEECEKLLEEGVLQSLPNFDTVTNGTILSDELIEIIKKYEIGVTLSFDGSTHMQDILRPFASGRGSSSTLLGVVKKMQGATDGKQPASVEVTYTHLHEINNVSVEACVNNIHSIFGIHDVKVTPVSCEADDLHHIGSPSSFISAIEDGFRKVPVDDRIVEKAYRLHQIIKSKKRSPTVFCGAGVNRFSIGVDGEVWPCYLFTNDMPYRIGNVMDSDFSLKRYESYRQTLMCFNRLEHEPCKECWASSFCFGCRGNNRRLSLDADTPSEDFCNMLKEVAETLFCCMANVGEIVRLEDVDMEQSFV